MNKTQFQEFLRLDMNIKKLEDGIKLQRNEQWQKKNEILKIGHKIEQDHKTVDELKKQQYSILGRSWVDLEEKKK